MTRLLDNRYRILRSLGEGGFGATFLAEDTRTPSQRRCVVKQLKPVTTPDAGVQTMVKERFTREAAVLEELGHNHPQIPLLYAYFEENGQFYLVQEYIQGETLTERVQRQGPWQENAVRSLLAYLLPVLAYIHQRGIIHRDIKPDNIILRDADGLPALIDFGAVKEAMSTTIISGGYAPLSMVIGTAGFMAPEQLAGRPVFSSDLYALALTAIYCLTGVLPQALDNNPMTGEIHWQHLVPGLSQSLAAVLSRSIHPNPQARFTTAAAMAQALERSSQGTVPADELAPTQVVSPRAPQSTVQTSMARPAMAPSSMAESTVVGRRPPAPPPRQQRPKGINSMLLISWLVAIAATSGLVTLVLSQRRGPTPTPVAEPTVTDPIATQPAEGNGTRPSPPPESSPSAEASPSPEPAAEPVPSPTATTPPPVEEPVTEPEEGEGSPEAGSPGEALTTDMAFSTVDSLYGYVSQGSWRQARDLFSESMAQRLDPDFFRQFQQVSVQNLRVTSQTEDTVELLGENTYVYNDGSTQQEERTFTIQMIDGEPRIVASDFVRIIKPR